MSNSLQDLNRIPFHDGRLIRFKIVAIYVKHKWIFPPTSGFLIWLTTMQADQVLEQFMCLRNQEDATGLVLGLAEPLCQQNILVLSKEVWNTSRVNQAQTPVNAFRRLLESQVAEMAVSKKQDYGTVARSLRYSGRWYCTYTPADLLGFPH